MQQQILILLIVSALFEISFSQHSCLTPGPSGSYDECVECDEKNGYFLLIRSSSKTQCAKVQLDPVTGQYASNCYFDTYNYQFFPINANDELIFYQNNHSYGTPLNNFGQGFKSICYSKTLYKRESFCEVNDGLEEGYQLSTI